MSDLYRRRLIPDECLHLKNDHIIHISKDIIVTKWNTIHPKADSHMESPCTVLMKAGK